MFDELNLFLHVKLGYEVYDISEDSVSSLYTVQDANNMKQW